MRKRRKRRGTRTSIPTACDRLAGQPPETCHLCAKPLTGRQRRWCSTRCERKHRINHRWTEARAAAKRKARVGERWRCAHCDSLFDTVEVNHIVPCMGNHGKWGCWHHETNLEVLCVPCHRAVTARQRKERANA